MACTEMNLYHSDKQDDRKPDQQNTGIGSNKDGTDGRQDNNSTHEVPENKAT